MFQATRCILVISGCSGFSAFNISYRRTTFPPLLLHHSEQPNRQPDSLIENTFICYREDTSYAALHMPAACHSTSDRWWNPIKRQRSPEVTHYLATSPAPTPFCSLFRRSLSLSLSISCQPPDRLFSTPPQPPSVQPRPWKVERWISKRLSAVCHPVLRAAVKHGILTGSSHLLPYATSCSRAQVRLKLSPAKQNAHTPASTNYDTNDLTKLFFFFIPFSFKQNCLSGKFLILRLNLTRK